MEEKTKEVEKPEVKETEQKAKRKKSEVEVQQEKWCANDEQEDILTRSYVMAERRGKGAEGSKWFGLTDAKSFKVAMAKAEAEQKEKKERQGSERKLWKLYRLIGENGLDKLLECNKLCEYDIDLIKENYNLLPWLPSVKFLEQLGLLDELKEMVKERLEMAFPSPMEKSTKK